MLRDESRPGGGSNSWLCGVGGAWMSLAVSVLLSTTAFAQNPHVYVSGGGIYIMPQDAEVSRPLLFREGGSIELHSALGGVGGVGIDWGGGIRTELEYGRRELELGKLNTRLAATGRPFELELDGDLTTDLLMANLLYVFKPGDMLETSWGGINVYVGAGGGVAWHVLKGANVVNSRDSVVAYQAMAGLSYDLTDALEVRSGYRYVGTGDYKDHGSDVSYDTHGLEFGFLYRFH
ncbi:MAG: outer membrane beta-barrel protein [Nitrospira sp.]|nr:outer membrane beta-barrel protein [Nitrospira sp.]